MNNVVEHDDRTPPAFGPGAPAAGGGPRASSSSRSGKARPVREWVAGWDWRTHPPVWATVNVCLAVLWLSWFGHKINAPWWIALVIGVLGLIGPVASGMQNDLPARHILWRAACWMAPAVWACVAIAFGPWHLWLLVAGAGLAVFGGFIARTVAHARRKLQRQIASGEVVAARANDVRTAYPDTIWNRDNPDETDLKALAINWRLRIKRVSGTPVEIPEIGMWEASTGYTLFGRLPRGGKGWKDLAVHAESLANDAGLPPTCGVTVRPDKRRRDGFEMQVVHVDVMGETLPWDGDCSPISIYHRFKFGRLHDGLRFTALLKWVIAVIIGQTGSGKSSMLAVVNTHFARCVDAILWHSDVGGGGGISRPWVTPWKEGRSPHPIVDWAAVTEGETETMLRAALAIIKGRKRAYAKLMRAAGDNKIPCSPEVPHIAIVIDEFGSLPSRIQDLAIEVSNTGRAAGVRLVIAALRGTSDYLPAAIKKQTRVRIGMRIDDPEEINYLFGWNHNVDPEMAPYEGSGFVMNQEVDSDGKDIGKKYLAPFKATYISETDIIETIAPAVAIFRPTLDAASAALANGVGGRKAVYDTRWERTLPLLFEDDDLEGDETAAPEPVPAAADRVPMAEDDSVADAHARMAELGEQLKAKWSGAETSQAPAPASQSTAQPEVDPGDVDAVFAELTSGGLHTVDQDADKVIDEAHRRDTALLELVDAAGKDGIGAPDLQRLMQARGFKVDYTKYIHRWLESYVDERLVVKVEVRVDNKMIGYLYFTKPNFREDQ